MGLLRPRLGPALSCLALAACANSRPGDSLDAGPAPQATVEDAGDGAARATARDGDGTWPVPEGSRFVGLARMDGVWRLGLGSRPGLTLVSTASGSTQVFEYGGPPDHLTAFGDEPFVVLSGLARSLVDQRGVSLDSPPLGELAREEDSQLLSVSPRMGALTWMEDTRVPLSPQELRAASQPASLDGAGGGCLPSLPMRRTETRLFAAVDEGGPPSRVLLSRVDGRWEIEGTSVAAAPDGMAVTYFETREAPSAARLLGARMDWRGRLVERVAVDRSPIEPNQGNPLLLADGAMLVAGARRPSSDSEDVVVVVVDPSGQARSIPLPVRSPVVPWSDLAALRCGGHFWIVAIERTEPDLERLLAFRMGSGPSAAPARLLFSHRYSDPAAAVFSRSQRDQGRIVVNCAQDRAAAAYAIQERQHGASVVAFAEWDARGD